MKYLNKIVLSELIFLIIFSNKYAHEGQTGLMVGLLTDIDDSPGMQSGLGVIINRLLPHKPEYSKVISFPKSRPIIGLLF